MIAEFQPGQKWPASREQLNEIVRALNGLADLGGDGLVTTLAGPTGRTIGLNLDLLAARLPRAGAGTGIAIQSHSNVIGRHPSREHSYSLTWNRGGAGGVSTGDTNFYKMNATINGVFLDAGVTVPCFGKITELTGLSVFGGAHDAGSMLVRLQNVTQSTSSTALQLTFAGSDSQAVLSDSATNAPLEVYFGDMIQPEIAGAFVPPKTVDVTAVLTFLVEERAAYAVTGTLTPDATGVCVRNRANSHWPLYERTDVAYRLYYNTGTSKYRLATAVDEASNYWECGTAGRIAGTYTANGTVTGTATVAVKGD